MGPYAVQAAIAALHAEAPTAAATDWTQIVGLYDVLAQAEPSPVIELNRAVAVAMRDGPEAGLVLVDAILARGDLADYHLAHSARADLCRRLGKSAEARASYPACVSRSCSRTTAARTCTASAALSVNDIGAYTWTSAGLAADVQSWLDGSDGNFGWILVSDEQTTFSVRAFASRSNFSENARPVLTIAYTEAIPEPATVVMLLAGLALLLGLNRKRLARACARSPRAARAARTRPRAARTGPRARCSPTGSRASR